ncbi:MAG: N-acetylneuraminate synthase family protein [Lachnospiraceae bacterium]|nr:N-acetylneuraminate synthase family protein [Lachnospiraceae bacterium]
MAKQRIMLGNTEVGDNPIPYFIAEIGINHNGDLQVAKRFMDAAFSTCWDCVKFQKRTPEIAVPEAQKNVMRQTPWGEMTYLDYKKHIEFGREEYDYIDSYCREKPLAWTASPWDLPSLEFLMKYDLPFIKVASAGNGNHELLKEVCACGKPVIMSDGMSTQEELDAAVEILEKEGRGEYILLHTNSTYPSPVDKLNLSYMHTLKERYGCIVGYSGHEQNLEPSVVAAAMGAKVIERHVTLSHDMWGTDQKASLEVNAMHMLYHRCADIYKMMGDGVKTLDEGELKVREKLKGN